MRKILSVQSHVAYGYVGNRAAVFPLQRLGFDVTAINTVQFSNHTGYSSWQGDVMTPAHIQKIIDGLRDLEILYDFSAVLSGYLGDSALGEIILNTVAEIRQVNSELVYCCDPVMGDVGQGLFVNKDLPDFFKQCALPKATITTPNQFEAECLTGQKIQTLEDAQHACKQLLSLGPKLVLLTSLETQETPTDQIQMLAYNGQDYYLISTKKFIFKQQPSGSGDLIAAMFLADYLQSQNLKQSLEHVANAAHSVFKQTYNKKSCELCLIEMQDQLLDPQLLFIAKKLN